jgi:hypothetical protein
LQTITFIGQSYNDSCYNQTLVARYGYNDEEKSVSVAEGVQAKLYPNPNNGSFTLAYDLKNTDNATVQILDVTGKIVFSNAIDNVTTIIQLHTSNLQSGIYFIQIMNSKTLLWTDKLMINK